MEKMQTIYKRALKKAQEKVFDDDKYLKVIRYCNYKLSGKVETFLNDLLFTEKGKLLKGTKKTLVRKARNFQDFLTNHCKQIDRITELGNKKTGIATHKYLKIWDRNNNLILSKKIA